jgi:hypothetical protein
MADIVGTEIVAGVSSADPFEYHPASITSGGTYTAPLEFPGVEIAEADAIPGLVIIDLITPIGTISKTTPIIIDVYGTTVPLRRAWINAAYAGVISDDMVHNGDRFGAAYQGVTNNRANITNGYRFTLLRDGGWPGTPSLDVHAVDTQGVGDST